MAGKERYKREIAMIAVVHSYIEAQDTEILRSNLMEQRYLLIRRTRFCCSSFSFTKYADSTELKRLHNIHYAK